MEGLQWPPCMAYFNRPLALGEVFYVRSDGDDNNVGTDPGAPWSSITFALTQCVAGRNDYIVVMNNTSANETFPIAVNKGMVHIIGLWGQPYPNPTIMGDAGHAAFQLEVDWIEIAGLELGAGDDATPIIQSPVGPGTIGHWWIHHCSFGWLNGMMMGSDGIWVQNTHDAPQCVIEDCMFNGPLAGSNGLTRDGIRIEGNATRSIFRNNIFKTIDGVGIHCMQNGSDIAAILDNKFRVPKVATGEAITMELGVGNAIISGNLAGFGAATILPANSPFRDLSTGVAATCLNAWMFNFDTDVAAPLQNALPVFV